MAGGGILTDAGDHLLDALLWTTGQAAVEVAAFQDRLESGLDLVTAAAVRLADGAPATVALSGVSADELFEMTYFGDRGRLRVTDRALGEESDDAISWAPPAPEPAEGIDANFVAAVLAGAPLCCPADQALDTVRLAGGDHPFGGHRAGRATRLIRGRAAAVPLERITRSRGFHA